MPYFATQQNRSDAQLTDISLRYGGEDLRSLSQVGQCMGLTKSTVQGLEQRALRQLRAFLHPRVKQEVALSLSA